MQQTISLIAKKGKRKLKNYIRAYTNYDELSSKFKKNKLKIENLEIYTFLPPLNTDSGNPTITKQLKTLSYSYITKTPKWSLDTFNNKEIPNKHFFKIKYSNTNYSCEKIGDFMIPNESSKHGWVILLSLCFIFTNNELYINRLLDLLNKWRNEFQVGHGVPYLTTINVAQRLIHWILALQILNPYKERCKTTWHWLAKEAYSEFLFLQNYNTFHHDIKNNFSICEAVAVLMYLTTFKKLFNDEKLYKLWQNRLKLEAEAQVNSDGFTLEGSLSYSRLIAESLLLALIFKQDYIEASLKRLTYSLYCLANNTGFVPAFGDISTERGFNFDETKRIDDGRTFFALASYFINENYILGEASLDLEYGIFTGNWQRPGINPLNLKRPSITFKQGGYTIINRKNWHLVTDHANIGLKNQGGHGHCDVGSFTLSNNTEDIIVDPGTYLYFADIKIRNHYRSSQMHNITCFNNAEMCDLSKGLFRIDNIPDIEANTILTPLQDSLKIILNGYSINDIKVPITRIIKANDNRIKILDTWKANYPTISHLHFAPTIELEIINNRCLVKKNKKTLLEVYAQSNCALKIETYGYSPRYNVTIPAKRLTFIPKTNHLEYNFLIN